MKSVDVPGTLGAALTARMTKVEEAWIKEVEHRFSAWRRGEQIGVPVFGSDLRNR